MKQITNCNVISLNYDEIEILSKAQQLLYTVSGFALADTITEAINKMINAGIYTKDGIVFIIEDNEDDDDDDEYDTNVTEKSQRDKDFINHFLNSRYGTEN